LASVRARKFLIDVFPNGRGSNGERKGALGKTNNPKIVENWALLRDVRRWDRMDIHLPRCLNMGGDIIVEKRS